MKNDVLTLVCSKETRVQFFRDTDIAILEFEVAALCLLLEVLVPLELLITLVVNSFAIQLNRLSKFL